MTQRIASNVGETSTTTGTGALTLAAAITGMIRFNAIPSIATSDTVPYMLFSVDGSGNRTTEWEYGIGTYSAANELTRTTVLGSSNAGSAVSLASGTKYVFVAPLGELLPHLYPDSLLYARTLAGIEGLVPQEYIMRLSADYTLTSTTSEQKLFNGSTNGRLTLPTGAYYFECLASISSLSATSGNGAFDILGAGGATLADVLYYSVGVDGATATAATQTGSTMIQGQSPASQQTAGTGTTWNFRNAGTFEITAAGTIVPSVTLVTAAAGVVRAGSFFLCKRIGVHAAATVVGQWD